MKVRITLWCPAFDGVDGGVQQFSRLVHQALGSLPGVAARRVTLAAGRPGSVAKAVFVCRALIDVFIHRPSLVIATHLHLARLIPLLRACGIPCWICLHGVECWEVEDPRDRNALRSAGRLLCVSRHTEKKIHAAFPELRTRTRILPDHVETPPPRPSRSVARARFGLPEEARILLTVSRLSAAERYKGHREILRLLPGLRATHPGLHYLVVGDGDDLPALRALTASLGLEAVTHFPGRLNAQDLELAYAAADALAMPSTGEGFGIVFLEALVRGLPVLAGNRDGSPDPLQDGKCGILVDPADPDSLTRGLHQLLEQDWDRTALTRDTLAVFGTDRLPGRLAQLLEET